MVGTMGLGGSLVSFRAVDPGIVGGNLAARVLADPTAREAVEALLDDQKAVVTELLRANRHLVVALRDALLDREELVAREIAEVLAEAEARESGVIDLERADNQTPRSPAPRTPDRPSARR
jgi:hypothetical protein